MIRPTRTSCVIAVMAVATLVMTGCGRPAARSSNVSRDREDVIKAAAVNDWKSQAAYPVAMTRELTFGHHPDGPRYPIAVTAAADGALRIVDNIGGRLFEANSSALREVPLAAALLFPSMIRRERNLVYIADENGLGIYEGDVMRRRVRSFISAYDFVPLGDGLVALSPISREDGAPWVILVDEKTGRVTASWGLPSAGAVGALRRTVRLARCGDRLVLGMSYAPTLHVLSPTLQLERTIDVPFPATAALEQLASDPALVRPSPEVVALPTYIAGVACSADALFVLLDLPSMRLLEYDREWTLRRTWVGATLDPRRHYHQLAVDGELGGYRLLTIAEDPVVGRSILEVFLPASDTLE